MVKLLANWTCQPNYNEFTPRFKSLITSFFALSAYQKNQLLQILYLSAYLFIRGQLCLIRSIRRQLCLTKVKTMLVFY